MRIQKFNQRRIQFGGAIPVFRGTRQHGGEISVFRGSRDYQYGRGFGQILKSHQTGDGFLNILSSIGKFAAPLVKKALPVVLKTGKKLVKHAISQREMGQSWGNSFKEAAPRAAYSTLKEVTPTDPEDSDPAPPPQSGKGYRKRQFGCGVRRLYKKTKHCNF